ncbi:curvature thylakoid 1D, chloroplastic-like protein [Tanacetum coccineum]
MELCTWSPSTRFTPKFKSNLTPFRTITSHQFKPSLPLKPATNNQASTPDETDNGANQYVKEESDSDVTVEEAQAEENSGFGGFSLFNDGAAADNELPQFDFLDKLKVELDLQDSFSIALLAVGGVSALWLTVSIVGAIDKIPLFPKLMEVVGLGYSIWFSSRYLLFKRNRDELASKIEEIKQQVMGPKN